jgi:hypothetical protein
MLLGTHSTRLSEGHSWRGVLRQFMHDPIRFHSLRDFGVFCLIAVL